MNTVAQLIAALGGSITIGLRLGIERNTVTYWGRRGRIPPEHWQALVELGVERRVEGIDHGVLLRLQKPRKLRSAKQKQTGCRVEHTADAAQHSPANRLREPGI